MQAASAPFLLLALVLASCTQTGSEKPASSASGGALIAIAGDGELVETERTASYSVMQVRRSPAGSVPSALFALRGACAILRARAENYVASEAISSSPATYRLTFPKSTLPESLKGATKSVFAESECRALRF